MRDGNPASSITCFTNNENRSKLFVKNLDDFAKKNNCLRGTKIKDIDLFTASFSEVEVKEDYTWDNYYYPQEVIDLLDLEVFEFIKNVDLYNGCGIVKRGIIIHGPPGTGKTTSGNIICNEMQDYTVIWITPEIILEGNWRAFNSIRSLYLLADFVSPVIILLEDLDLIGQDRNKGGDTISLGALMNILDGVNSIRNSVTIAYTNRLEIIETALRNRPGRFDRIIEIPPLPDDLRKKMYKNRLKDWTFEKNTLQYLVEKTDNWTGAEVQEFINGLNLKYISSSNRKNRKIITKKWIDEIIATMQKFGIGENSSFGFGKNN